MPHTDTRTPNPDFYYEDTHISELGNQWKNKDPGKRFFKMPKSDVYDLVSSLNKTALEQADIDSITDFPAELMLPYNMAGNHWVVFTVNIDLDAAGEKVVKIQYSNSLKGHHSPKYERINDPKVLLEKDRIRKLFAESPGYKAENVTVSDYPHQWLQIDESGRVEHTSCGPYIIENATRALAGKGAETNPKRMAIRKKQLDAMTLDTNVRSCSRDKQIEKVLEYWADAHKDDPSKIVPSSLGVMIDKYVEAHQEANKQQLKDKFRSDFGRDDYALRKSLERIRTIIKGKVHNSRYTAFSRVILDAIKNLRNGRPARAAVEKKATTKLSESTSTRSASDVTDELNLDLTAEGIYFFSKYEEDKVAFYRGLITEMTVKAASMAENIGLSSGEAFIIKRNEFVAAIPNIPSLKKVRESIQSLEKRDFDSLIRTKAPTERFIKLNKEMDESLGYHKTIMEILRLEEEAALSSSSSLRDSRSVLVSMAKEAMFGSGGPLEFAPEEIKEAISHITKPTKVVEFLPAIRDAYQAKMDARRKAREDMSRVSDVTPRAKVASKAGDVITPPAGDPTPDTRVKDHPDAPPPSYEKAVADSFLEKYPNFEKFYKMLKEKLDTEINKSDLGLVDVLYESAKGTLIGVGGTLENAPDNVKIAVSDIPRIDALEASRGTLEAAYNQVELDSSAVAPASKVEKRSIEDALIYLGRNCKFAEDTDFDVEATFESVRESLLREARDNNNVVVSDVLGGIDSYENFKEIVQVRKDIKRGIDALTEVSSKAAPSTSKVSSKAAPKKMKAAKTR